MNPRPTLHWTAFPLAVNFIFAWACTLLLLLLAVLHLTPQPESSPYFVLWLFGEPWSASRAPVLLIRIQVLLALWLWLDHRGVRRRDPHWRRVLPAHLTAGFVLLLLTWALRASTQSMDPGAWKLTRLYP